MAQATEITAYSRQTLMRWIREGKLTAVKSGPATAPLLIPAAEIERIRQEHVAELRQLLARLTAGQCPEVTREPESPLPAGNGVRAKDTEAAGNDASAAVPVASGGNDDSLDDFVADALGIPEMERC